VTEPGKAVFLSYASQDANAAAQICAALRAAGIEVWFDQSALKGGDAWDSAIRKQIKACALFIPVISRNTHARDEGYFRLEWKLAVDRSYLMTAGKAFLLPVVIDDTRDSDEQVPDKFREVHWTHLAGGGTPPAFIERVLSLLSPDKRAPLAGAPPTTATSPEIGGPARGRSKLLLVLVSAMAALAIAIGYFTIERFMPAQHSVQAGRATNATSAASAPLQDAIPQKSIAVLPFVNMSPDKDQEYFSDGLTEELLDLLAQVPDLRVPARTSSFYFKGKTDDIASIAQRLRVAHVLEGSVRRSGNTIRVTAQLIRADTGYHLWSTTYERNISDIFKVQDEIATAVVAALKAQLLPAQQTAHAHRTSNTEAYNEYLLGRQFYNQRTDDGFRHALTAYRKAIALDPDYAAAYAGLAMSEALLADSTGDSVSVQQAAADAETAVTRAPDLADSYATRGFVRYFRSWDWNGAQADFVKALALDPSDSTVLVRYGGLLSALGRLPEAIAATKKATELDPLSALAWVRLGRYYIASRQFAAAHDALRRALEILPESVSALSSAGTLQLLEGRAAEALVTFRRIPSESVRLADVALAEHSLGHAEESQRALDEVIKNHTRDSAYAIAEAYAWRGEKEQALAWLERAYEHRDSSLFNLKSEPRFNSLLGDPRYRAFLRKMNLPE
jgi:TolB-like protein